MVRNCLRILHKLFFFLLHTPQTYLLQLELDGGSQLLDFAHHIITVGDHGREFSGLVQTGSQNTRNL